MSDDLKALEKRLEKLEKRFDWNHEPTTPDDYAKVVISRVASYEGGTGKIPAPPCQALYVQSVIKPGAGNNQDAGEWAGSFLVRQQSDHADGVALSGVAVKEADGIVWAGHFNAKDETGGPTLQGLIGAEVNLAASDLDDNRNRIGVDVVCRTILDPATFHTGVRVRTKDARWNNGIQVDGETNVHLRTSGVTTWVLRDTSSASVGISLEGTYSAGAIRIRQGESIQLDDGSEGGIKIRFNPETQAIEFTKMGQVKHAFNMSE